MSKNILQQAYPFKHSFRSHVLQAFYFGLFIFLFLIIFQPFGLQQYQAQHKTLILAGYGLLTFFGMLANHLLFSFLLPNWYSRKTWTVGKNISYVLWVFFVIGICNWAYTSLLIFKEYALHTLFTFQALTLVIGIFPITISTFIIYFTRLKEALRDAQLLNQTIHKEHTSDTQLLNIPSQNKSEQISLILDKLLYIKAIENYVEVQTDTEKIIVRNTLKSIEQSISAYPQIRRCHRSYLVNLHQVASFSGNAQGLSLQFKTSGVEDIPVSRTYVPEIKANL